MFNPYACRPIGTKRFEEHLKDVQTERYYATEMTTKTDDIPETEMICGKPPWKTDIRHDNNGWQNLATAIFVLTILDYLDCYLKRNHALREDLQGKYTLYESYCLELENEYFRVDPYREMIFDKLLYAVCWMGDQEIRRCMTRMKYMLRWTKIQRRVHTRQKHDV